MAQRKKASYTGTIISMTLVLYLFGMFSFLILQADRLKDYFRENLRVSVYYRDTANEADIMLMQESLSSLPYVVKSEFVSKEEARKELQQELGEDFVDVLGYNPLPHALRLYFRADYARSDSIRAISRQLEQRTQVREVYYEAGLLERLDKNIRIVGIAIIGFALVLLVVSVTLINNAIRLNLYSKRFLIKSMQLVGATQWFIRKPFLARAAVNGFAAGVFAVGLTAASLWAVQEQLPLLEWMQYRRLALGGVALGLVVLGMAISYVSSLAALNKFLQQRLEDLY
jgi:cell division transport system permease protein